MRRVLLLAAAVLLPLQLAWAGPAAGGITWQAPPAWKEQPSRPMRAATYVLPSRGAEEAPELAVFYFGEGQGGAVDANVERWAGQFEAPGSAGKRAEPKVTRQTLNGLKVTRVATEGTYRNAMGPRAPATPKPGFRLLGAIVEGPSGPVFFKLTGPARSVAASEKQFDRMVATIRPSK